MRVRWDLVPKLPQPQVWAPAFREWVWAITGFTLVADGTNVFSTSTVVTGKVYGATHAVPTPATLSTAIDDQLTAYNDAAGRTAEQTNLGAGALGGLNLTPAVYKWTTAATMGTDLTLTGSATDRWILQIDGSLTMSPAVEVKLVGGALAKNVVWQVAGAVTIGTTVKFAGVLLGATRITSNNGATINGRFLAQTAVTIAANTITPPPS